METEKFDESIRKKLESINPVVSDAEISSVHNHVLKNISKISFWKIYRNTFMYSAAAAVIGVLLVWNIVQLKEQKLMQNTIETLQHDLSDANKKERKYDSNNSTSKIDKQKNKTYSEVKKTEPEILNQNIYISKEKDASSVDLKKQEIKNLMPENIIKQNYEYVELPVKSVASLHQKKIKNKMPDAINIAENDAPDDPNFKKKNNPIATKIHFQAGIGFDAARGNQGFSLLGKVLMAKGLSVNAGLKFSGFGGQHFDDDNDFHHRTGNHIPGTPPMGNNPIDNIHTKYEVLQIPLNFSYIVPFKLSGFTFPVSVGTELDLHATQNFEFHFAGGPELIKSGKIESSVLFNNINFSLGFQKKIWKNLMMEVDGFTSNQLKQVAYKNQNLYSGLRFRILYNIGKS